MRELPVGGAALGAVAGSGHWWDAAQGVLYMHGDRPDRAATECRNPNHGPTRRVVTASPPTSANAREGADLRAGWRRYRHHRVHAWTARQGVAGTTQGPSLAARFAGVMMSLTRKNLRGWVWFADLYSSDQCATSNQAEIFYGRVPDPDGVFGHAWTKQQTLDYYPSLLTHEIAHLVQGAADVFGGADYATWELEGGATLSEQLVAYRLFGHGSGRNLGYAAYQRGFDWYHEWVSGLARFLGSDSDDPTHSRRIPNAPEECSWMGRPEEGNDGPCTNAFRAVYDVPSVELRYAMDRWEDDYSGGEQALMRRLTRSPTKGLASLADVSGWPAEQILADFYIALWLDLNGWTPTAWRPGTSTTFGTVFRRAPSFDPGHPHPPSSTGSGISAPAPRITSVGFRAVREGRRASRSDPPTALPRPAMSRFGPSESDEAGGQRGRRSRCSVRGVNGDGVIAKGRRSIKPDINLPGVRSGNPAGPAWRLPCVFAQIVGAGLGESADRLIPVGDSTEHAAVPAAPRSLLSFRVGVELPLSGRIRLGLDTLYSLGIAAVDPLCQQGRDTKVENA